MGRWCNIFSHYEILEDWEWREDPESIKCWEWGKEAGYMQMVRKYYSIRPPRMTLEGRNQWNTVFKKGVTCIPLICGPNMDAPCGIHPQKKCFCRSQHHKPRDPGDVLPTYVLYNKQIDLGPGYEHESGPCTDPCPSCLQSSSPPKHWLRQSPTDKKDFVEVQDSSRELPAHCWSKKIRGWTRWRG